LEPVLEWVSIGRRKFININFLIISLCILGAFGYGDAFHQVELIVAALLGFIRGNKEPQEGK